MFDSFRAHASDTDVGERLSDKSKAGALEKNASASGRHYRLYRESCRSTIRPVGLLPLAMVPARHLDAVVFLRNAPAEVGMHHIQTMVDCLGKPVKL